MDETALKWIIFILAFGGMVVVHEFGHFIAARLVKVEVEEFGIGFPTPGAVAFWISPGYLFLRNGRRIEIPRNFRMPVPWGELVDHDAKLTVREENGKLVLRAIEVATFEEKKQVPSVKPSAINEIYVGEDGKPTDAPQPEAQKTVRVKKLVKAGRAGDGTEMTNVISEVHPGTRFTINWLPIGGFVRPRGDNDPNIPGGLAAASPWKRLFVLTAGPAMNLLAAVLIFSLIISQMGGIIAGPTDEGTSGPQEILITEVVTGSPAEQAGLQMGDVLLTVNGSSPGTTEDVSNVIRANENIPLLFEISRGTEIMQLTITPRMNESAGRPQIGVSMCGGCQFQPITSPFTNLQYSLQMTGAQINALVTLPVRLLMGTIPPEQGRLVGLKGIFDIMSQSISNDVEASQAQTASSAPNPYNAPVQTLLIIALLSISLGIFNLFPFPALDGGRILFVLPEIIFRRRVPHQFENLVHAIGMTLLLAVMIYINVRDFIDPVLP